jgi:hypothetical protein
MLWLLSCVAGVWPGDAFGDLDDDLRQLVLHCRYVEGGDQGSEFAFMARNRGELASPPAIWSFHKGSSGEVRLGIGAGQVAECIFPSGNRVRAKVGDRGGRPYGMCGADGEVITSLWVNRRKAVSSEWFTGHCREETGFAELMFRFKGGSSVVLEKCETEVESRMAQDAHGPERDGKAALPVCTSVGDINALPVDVAEYPAPGAKKPKVGDIERLVGSGPLCDTVHKDLTRDFETFGYDYALDTGNSLLPRPAWRNVTESLPDDLRYVHEGRFDFDNDGKPDRVFISMEENSYMVGSAIVVQRGPAVSPLRRKDGRFDPSLQMWPCQMGNEAIDINDCPPLSQKADDAGFSITQPGGKELVHFRARYTSLAPFIYSGSTYLGAASASEDTEHYVAVLKPLPARRFKTACLFRKVIENF